MNDALEPLRSFILPGGGRGAARSTSPRAIVRRAERSAVQRRAAHPARAHYLNRSPTSSAWPGWGFRKGGILWNRG